MRLLIKILSFCLRKSTSSFCYQMSSLAVWVNEERSDEEWMQSSTGGLRSQAAAVEAAEGKFSIAAACWGLELMSVPTYVACHQNPPEPLVWIFSCSANFLCWLHTGLLECCLQPSLRGLWVWRLCVALLQHHYNLGQQKFPPAFISLTATVLNRIAPNDQLWT